MEGGEEGGHSRNLVVAAVLVPVFSLDVEGHDWPELLCMKQSHTCTHSRLAGRPGNSPLTSESGLLPHPSPSSPNKLKTHIHSCRTDSPSPFLPCFPLPPHHYERGQCLSGCVSEKKESRKWGRYSCTQTLDTS